VELAVAPDPRLSAWLVSARPALETRLAQRLGSAAPGPASPEAEALRRFRSFASSALLRGSGALPALDGLRASPPAVSRLLEAWIECAAELAGPHADPLRAALLPLGRAFATALRGSSEARRASGAPRPSARRAVSAAIDRLADAFLAIDTDSLRIADANPAAGALLGVPRDRLLEREALHFVPAGSRGAWTTHVEAMAEAAEPRRFRDLLQDVTGALLPVEARVTRFASRSRTLALVLVRPMEG
jgi:PAS domain-containing protein